MRDAMPAVICRRCRAQIGWVKTEQGKPMPVDHAPNPAGNVIVSFTDGHLRAHVLLRSEMEAGARRPDGVTYMPHFPTCQQNLDAAKAKPVAVPKPPGPEQGSLL